MMARCADDRLIDLFNAHSFLHLFLSVSIIYIFEQNVFIFICWISHFFRFTSMTNEEKSNSSKSVFSNSCKLIHTLRFVLVPSCTRWVDNLITIWVYALKFGSDYRWVFMQNRRSNGSLLNVRNKNRFFIKQWKWKISIEHTAHSSSSRSLYVCTTCVCVQSTHWLWLVQILTSA